MEPTSLLTQWNHGIRVSHIGHLRAAVSNRRRSRLLGIPATILSVIVGTSIFATLGNSDVRWVLITVAVISMLNAVISGLQTWLNYGELAERHRWSGTQFGGLRREVEQLRSLGVPESELAGEMTRIREEWQALDESAPPIPQRIQNAAERKAAERPSPDPGSKELER